MNYSKESLPKKLSFRLFLKRAVLRKLLGI